MLRVTAAVTPKGERRRYALVSAAADLLCEGGFDAVRHRAVARRAGLPLASTTYYFSSLDDLIAKAVEHVGTRETEELRDRVAALSRRRRGAESTADLLVDLLVGEANGCGYRAADLALRALHRLRAATWASRHPAAHPSAAHRRRRRGRRTLGAGGTRRTGHRPGVRGRRCGGRRAGRGRRRSARHRAGHPDRRHRRARTDQLTGFALSATFARFVTGTDYRQDPDFTAADDHSTVQWSSATPSWARGSGRCGGPPIRLRGRMAGKRVVVTGATAGIGEAMAESFAELGATVHLLGRNEEKVRHRAGAIRGEVAGAVVIEEVCDVSDLDAVRRGCDDLSGRIDALHGLVHNAGVMPKERTETPQGHETQLACHVLGPQVMTEAAAAAAQRGRRVGRLHVVGRHVHHAVDAPTTWSRPGLQRRPGLRTDQADAGGARRGLGPAAGGRPTSASRACIPGWVETPGVAEALPTFRADQAVAARPRRRRGHRGLAGRHPARFRGGHFWHDRAQRPTTFGWQRPEDPDVVADSSTRFRDDRETMLVHQRSGQEADDDGAGRRWNSNPS